jgi:hypothetical protein
MAKGKQMKLLFCKECTDVRKLRYSRTTCECGSSWGWYEKDGRCASIGGEALVIGLDNEVLVDGLEELEEQDSLAPIVMGRSNPQLTAWLFAEGYHRIKRVPSHLNKLEEAMACDTEYQIDMEAEKNE